MRFNSYYGFSPASHRSILISSRLLRDSEDALRHSRSSEAYFCTEPKYKCFRSPAGMIVYKQRKRHIFAIGGLIAETDRRTLLQHFLSWIQQEGYRLTFFNVSAEDLPLFQEFGCVTNKWGEEAVIPLENWSWNGKDFEWLRRQRNYCVRFGATVQEETPTEGLIEEFTDICKESLADKPQRKEWGLLQSSINPMHWGKRRLFVARHEGAVIGFLIALPYLDGKGWLFDIFRHRADAIRGVVPFMMMHAIDKFKMEGCKEVSLAMIPGRGCRGVISNKILKFLIDKIAYKIPFVFDTAGIDHFKSRFRPIFHDRWICSFPSVSLRGTISVVRELGILDLHVWKTLKIMRRQKRKKSVRENLDVSRDKPVVISAAS